MLTVAPNILNSRIKCCHNNFFSKGRRRGIQYNLNKIRNSANYNAQKRTIVIYLLYSQVNYYIASRYIIKCSWMGGGGQWRNYSCSILYIYVLLFTIFTISIYCFSLIIFFINQQENQSRDLELFHFTAWPDKGVPSDVNSILDFRRIVKTKSTITGPIVVHCR